MAGSETHYTLPRPSFDKPVKLLIVVAPYYKDIADNMVAGATAEIEAAGGTFEICEVPARAGSAHRDFHRGPDLEL